MIYSIKEHRPLPHGHIRVKDTPITLCEGHNLSSGKVEEELVFSGAVVVHPVFSDTFDRDRMLAMTPGWNHTVPYPGRPPWKFVVVIPPLEKIPVPCRIS